MLKNIDWWTVIASIIFSTITAHIVIIFQMKKIMNVLNDYTIDFMNDMKNLTIEIVKRK